MINENNYTVYMHTSPSGKAYIGITSTSVEERWDNGKGYLKKKKNGGYKQPAMANAVLKYGWERFDHIVFETNLSKEDAEHMEKLLIDIFQTRNKRYGYNIREGGGSTGRVSEETRLKMIIASTGRKHTEEEKRKISEANKGEKHPMFGKHFSDDARKKMSEAQKARWTDDERKKVSERMKGKKRSRESVCAGAKNHRKKIFCIELNKEFDSLKSAAEEMGKIGHTAVDKRDLLPSPEEEVGEGVFAAPLRALHQITFINFFFMFVSPKSFIEIITFIQSHF